MQAVDKAYKKLYELGALFTFGALAFTLMTTEHVYTGWEQFIVMVLGTVGWPITWGAIVANILNTYVGG